MNNRSCWELSLSTVSIIVCTSEAHHAHRAGFVHWPSRPLLVVTLLVNVLLR